MKTILKRGGEVISRVEYVPQKETPDEKKCLYPPCKNNIRARGLCYGHYNSMAQLVSRKGYTWEYFEQVGACLPVKRVGKKGLFESWIKTKAEEKGVAWTFPK